MGQSKILIFAGTTEGRLLASELADRFAVTACAATEYGADLLRKERKNICVHSGRLERKGIETLLQEGFFCVIDATHPYAKQVTENIRQACQEIEVPYYRLHRQESNLESAQTVKGAEEAAAFLTETEGNILLTTGSKEIEPFLIIKNWQERIYLRALPTIENLEKCSRLGIPPSHICLMQGPFSREIEESFLRHWKIRYVVMKDSGKEGGTQEKLLAAKSCGVQAVVLVRPAEPDGYSMEQLVKILEKNEKGGKS